MDSLPVRIRAALGSADITGWAYELLTPEKTGNAGGATEAVRGRIGDLGNARLLFEVSLENLDPVADADAYQLLATAPAGSTLAYEVACQLRR